MTRGRRAGPVVEPPEEGAAPPLLLYHLEKGDPGIPKESQKRTERTQCRCHATEHGQQAQGGGGTSSGGAAAKPRPRGGARRPSPRAAWEVCMYMGLHLIKHHLPLYIPLPNPTLKLIKNW